MSTGLIALSVRGRDAASATDAGQKSSVENDFACRLPPGRSMNSASPCRSFVPDLVTMLSAGPEVQPYSAENAFERTATSWMAPSGTVAIAVWRPHPSSLFAPSSVNVVARREPTPVMKYVALTKRSPVPLPCRNAELSSGSVVDLAAEDRRLVDLRAVEPEAELRIGAHAFGGAVDGDLALAAARTEQLHADGRRLAGAQRDVVRGGVGEARLVTVTR